MSIGMTPFKALYGYEALNFADLVFGDNIEPKAKDWIQDSQDILKTLKRKSTDNTKPTKVVRRQTHDTTQFRGGRLGIPATTTL